MQKGIFNLGIISLIIITAGLFAVTKLASNPDLTFFNISEKAAGITRLPKIPKDRCNGCDGRMALNWDSATKVCTMKYSTACESSGKKDFAVLVKGQKTVYKPGEKINLTVTVTENFDRSPGTPDEGFGVQAYVEIPATKTISGVNGQYDKGVWSVNLAAPTDKTKIYRISVAGYCALDGSTCAQRHGQAKQVGWVSSFRVK